MKIALISTPWIAVPPQGYGGTEYVVHNLTEGLTKKGHDVTLYATGDSKVASKLAFLYPTALGNNFNIKLNPYNMFDHLFHFFKNVSKSNFDIIHNHAGRMACYFLEFQNTPFVHTLHGNYSPNIDDQYHINSSGRNLLLKLKNHPYVSISNCQRKDIPQLNFVATIYNSIHINMIEFTEAGNDNIIWLGRISKTKGVENVIKIAKTTGKNLKLSVFVDEGEREYYEKEIRPQLNDKKIQLIPEMKNNQDKSNLYSSGKLYLFPIVWDEPFGIVMIEAMAAGTPVVAFARGSVPEVVKDGVTGFIVNSSEVDIRGNWIIKKTGIEGLCEAVEKIYSMPEGQYRQMRRNCRSHVEKNFTVEKMVDEYEKVYKQILLKQ